MYYRRQLKLALKMYQESKSTEFFRIYQHKKKFAEKYVLTFIPLNLC